MSTDERIEKIERQLARVRLFNRYLIACIILCFVVGLLFLVAGSRVKEIRSNRFIIDDYNGKTRAIFGMGNEGPMMWLNDKNGTYRVIIGMFKDGPMLSLHDEKSKPRTVLSVLREGPSLVLRDENGTCRAGLSMFNYGPILSLYDEHYKACAELAVIKNVPAVLRLYDENGTREY